MAYLSTMSDVRIANLALSNIGNSGTIQSFSELSTEANVTSLWYDFARLQVLESSDWNFARKTADLALHSDAPPALWGYRYQRPVDCVSIRKIVNPSGPDVDAIPYRIENSLNGETETILIDLEDAQVDYTFNATEVNLFSTTFITGLSYLLAHYISMPLTNSPEIQDAMLQKYIGFIRIAAARNANEEVQAPPRDAEWIRGR